MTLVLNGTTGVSAVDGSAATPAIQGNDTNTGIFFPAADTIAFAEGGAEVARFDSSGNFGIGTSSPGRRLEVRGADAAARFRGSSTQYLDVTATAGGTVNLDANNGDLAFSVNTVERARIDSSGNLLVGTTSATNNSRLKVQGSSTSSADYMVQFTDSAGANAVYIKNDRSVFSDGIYNSTTASAANVFINGSAQLQRSTSSLKYKTDVHDATHGLAEVMQLRPVTYKGKNDGDTIFGGLIAEEVDAAGLTEFVQYAEDGTPDALAYGNMVSLCIKAIQEQQAIIEQLKADVAALKGAQA